MTTPKFQLRSEPCELSDEDVEAMVKRYNFYNRGKNESGEFKNDFKDIGDGTVTDRATGLMWQQSGTEKHRPYNSRYPTYTAKAYIDELNQKLFAGYNDWRLPTLEELASLLENNKEKKNYYINSLFDMKQWGAGVQIHSLENTEPSISEDPTLRPTTYYSKS